jgi:drug/metabolite transporter (DMT)-like permease
VNIALILGLITFVGWGIGDLFTIAATRRIGANLTTFWIFSCSFVLALLFIPFAPHDLALITWPLLVLNLFLGILFISGNVLISEAFRTSSAPLVGIIIQAFPAVVLVLSAFVYGDVITQTQAVYIGIIFIGVVLCSVDFKRLFGSEKIFDRGTVLALIAMIFLSIFFTFSRILINAYGWFLPNLIATACFPIIYLFIKVRREKLIAPKLPIVVISVFMAGLLIRAADFSLNWGLSIPGASSLVAPIAGAAPILFVVMSYLVYKDKLTKQQVLGIVVTLFGIIFLTVGF